MPKFPKYFDNLDALRAIAALAVFFFHRFTVMANPDPEVLENSIYKAITPFMRQGHLGVNFFFVLSGFLITWLMIREIITTGKFSIRDFLVRRTLRIWPLYFLIVAVGFLLIPSTFTIPNNPHNPVFFLTFTSNFDEIIHGANSQLEYLTVLWSISVEEQFYIAWAIVIGAFLFRRLRTFLIFFAIILAGSIAFRLMHTGEYRILYYHTLSVISDMAIGGALAAIVRYRYNWIEPYTRIRRWKIILFYLLGIGYIGVRSKVMTGELFAFDRLVTGTFWAFVIFDQCFCKNSFINFGRWVWLNYLGRISYGLYMYHLIVMFILYQWWEGRGLFESSLSDIGVFTLLSLVLTVIIAAISYRFMERPILKFKERFKPASKR